MKSRLNRLLACHLALAAGSHILLCLNLPAAESAQSSRTATNHFGLEHLNQIVRLSDPRISPDGKSIVVVVERSDPETNRWTGELVLVDTANGEHRTLTHERKEVRHPRWSPSGDRLAFLAPHGAGKEKATQIFVLPMNGGEAQRITKSPTSVQHFAWRPDGMEIAFAAEDESKKEIEKGDDAFEVGNDDLFTSAAPMPVHIWLVPAHGGTPRRLTSGSWTLPIALPPSPPASPLSWSPDGKRLAFVKQETPHSGDADKSAVQIIDVSTGTIQPVTGEKSFEGFPSFSPDGTALAYWCFRDRDPLNVNDLFIAPATCGAGTNLTRSIDRNLCQCLWMPSGKSILTGGHDGSQVALWEVSLDGKARRLDLGAANPSWLFWLDVDVGRNGSIAFTGSEPDRPTELYFMPGANARPRRLTDFNHGIAALELGRVETVEWAGPDGFRENGILIYPPGYQHQPGAGRSARLPLVLLVHGGPQSASTTIFSSLGQLLASHGYLVFSPNYRGSDNLGNAYQRAIYNDAGAGPDHDVMAGLEAVRARGIVDDSRIAVTGWSYGGYMTSWLIGHHSIWRAAVAGAALTDWTDSYCFADFNVQTRYNFPGTVNPWTPEGEKLYREQSPMTYVAAAKTPTLVLCTTGDARVPPTQSYKLFHALKDAGVPASMVAYPVPGHFPGDPLRSRDVYRRWAEWLDKYMGMEAPQ
jgi:dipeptidyl aminopeptidase/acylaminoacyl peptidase